MTTFADDFSALALPELLAVYGEKVKYICEGDGATVTGLVSIESSKEDRSQSDRRIRVRRVKVTITTDPTDTVNGGVAEPSLQGMLEVRGNTYAITEVDMISDGAAMIVAEERKAIERSTRDYRSARIP